MEARPLDINIAYNKSKKPSKPHITDGQETVSEEEIKNRMRVTEELESLGISTSKFDIEDGHEDSDELQAILLVRQGKKVPEDLKKRLKNKQIGNQREENKTKGNALMR